MCFLINCFCLIKTIGAAFVAKALNVSDKVVTLGIWVSVVTLDFYTLIDHSFVTSGVSFDLRTLLGLNAMKL